MNPIRLLDVSVDLPVLSVQARSLRKTVMNLSTGGRLMKNDQNKILVRALANVSFELMDGDRLGLIGHNGSGKSTLLRTLAGIYRVSAGHVAIQGRVVSILDPATGLNPDASGRENIGLLGRYMGHSRVQIEAAVEAITDFAGLGAFIDMPVKSYSQGMVGRLAFAVGTHWEHEIVLMDEWIAVADDAFKASAFERLNNLMSSARCVVVASHDQDLLRRLCNKVLVLKHGTVSYFGPIEHMAMAA